MATSPSRAPSTGKPTKEELEAEEAIAIAVALLVQNHEGSSRYGRISSVTEKKDVEPIDE